MRKFYRRYLFIPLFLLLAIIIFSGCGGEDGGYTNPAPLAEPSAGQLTSKEVSGYIFRTGSVASIEGAEEKAPGFIILDSPITGENSFLSQFSGYFQEFAPDEWNSPEVQEIYEALNREMANWQTLPQWNSSARLFTVYQDSKSATPLTVEEDGYFEGTVLVEAGDGTVKFEVLVGDNECYPVETLPLSDITGSCDTRGTTLKSCPEMLLSLPGDCIIFRVYSVPPVNLKEAGLFFSLIDTSVGHVIKHPFYMQCKGKVNYNVAYGVFKAKNNLTTPAYTTIKTETDTGLTLDILVEIVKNCSSVSGHAGGYGIVPLCGFVYSTGFSPVSCLDGEGNYKLDRVFQGINREVTAVWWVMENGGIKKYRETRTMNYLFEDTVDYNFGEPRRPTDNYYMEIAEKILRQKAQWEQELGYEQGVKKTVDWLNKNVSSPPLPAEIAEAISKAEVYENDPEAMTIVFTDDRVVNFSSRPSFYRDESELSESMTSQNADLYEQISPSSITSSSDRITTKNSKVVILGPFTLNHYHFGPGGTMLEPSVHNDILKELEDDRLYEVKAKVTTDLQFEYYNPYIPVWTPINMLPVIPVLCKAKIADDDSVIRPQDFENIDEYGIIYIDTIMVGLSKLVVCPYFYDPTGKKLDEKLKGWLDENRDYWEISFQYVTHYIDWDNYGPDWKPPTLYAYHIAPMIVLKPSFFDEQDFHGSLVFFHNKDSFAAYAFKLFSDSQVFVGFHCGTSDPQELNPQWSIPLSYYFFYYMMHGYILPTEMKDVVVPSHPPPSGPLSVSEAETILEEVNERIMPDAYIEPGMGFGILSVGDGPGHEYSNTYFPVPTMVEVTEE